MRSLDGSGGVDVWRPSFAEEDSILEECEEVALDGDQVLDGHP